MAGGGSFDRTEGRMEKIGSAITERRKRGNANSWQEKGLKGTDKPLTGETEVQRNIMIFLQLRRIKVHSNMMILRQERMRKILKKEG